MSEHFTEADLESLQFDRHEPSGLARCPWCGADIVLGVRLETRNVSLAHAAHPDPTDTTGTRYVSGCAPFVEALGHDDVIRRLVNAGARFTKLVA